MSSPAKTARKLAKQAVTEESRALIEQFAADLESWEIRLNNSLQTAISLTDLHLSERMDGSDARQVKILELLETLQQSIAALERRPPCMHPDLSRAQMEEGDEP